MTDKNSDVWRDEERLPLQELDQALARSPGDGQGDDVTGNEAGPEEEFGHGAEAATGRSGAGDSHEPTDSQRAYRPSTTGRTGPDV